MKSLTSTSAPCCIQPPSSTCSTQPEQHNRMQASADHISHYRQSSSSKTQALTHFNNIAHTLQTKTMPKLYKSKWACLECNKKFSLMLSLVSKVGGSEKRLEAVEALTSSSCNLEAIICIQH